MSKVDEDDEDDGGITIKVKKSGINSKGWLSRPIEATGKYATDGCIATITVWAIFLDHYIDFLLCKKTWIFEKL